MSRHAMLAIAAAVAGTPALALAQVPYATPIIDAPPVIGSDAVPPEAVGVRKSVQCDGERFVFAWGAGSNPTRVTLCGNKGASREALVRMLEEAAAKLQDTTSIPEDRRIVLVQQIHGKIAELKGAEMAKPAASAAVANSKPVSVPGVTALKPIAPRSGASDATAAAASMASPVLRAKSKLSLKCHMPGDVGAGVPCTELNRDTRLMVKAGEPIPAGTTLRFARNRQVRGAVALGPLRGGQEVRLSIPPEICRGLIKTQLEVQIVQGNQVVDTRGPYLMRC